MKKLLLILSLVFPLLVFNVASVHAQQSVGNVPSIFFCVGNNPQPPCATVAPTQGQTIPSQAVSPSSSTTQPSTTQTNPSPSQSASPSTSPCSTSNQSASTQSKTSNPSQAQTKIHAAGQPGLLQQLMQLLLQIISLLLQQLGAQPPSSGGGSGGGTGTPCPSTAPSAQPSGSVSQSPSSAPSSAVSPTTQPSTTPSGAPSSAVSQAPSSAPSTSPSSAVSPTGEHQQPTVTPAPGSSNLPSWLQQLLQMILQLLQLIAQHLGINPCGTSCPTPSGTPTPSSSPSGNPSQSPSGNPSTAPSNSPSSAPSESPTPTIFNAPTATPTPSTAVSPSQSPSQGVSPSPSVTPTVVASGLLKSALGNICVDNYKQITDNNNKIVIWGCNSNDKGQKFALYSDNTIRYAPTGTTTLPTKCLDVTKNAKGNNSTIELFDCNVRPNQQWMRQTIANGKEAQGLTQLQSPASGRCLDDKARSTTPGTQLEIYDCNGGKNQAWSFTTATITPAPTCNPVPKCTPTATHVCPDIVNACPQPPAGKSVKVLASGLKTSTEGTPTKSFCLDDFKNADKANTSNQVVIWTCDGSAGEQWSSNSDNTIKVNGLCLDVFKNKKTDGSVVDLFTCNKSTNQQWTVSGKQLKSKSATGECLTVKGGKAANQTQVEIDKCSTNNAADQSWTWTTVTASP